MVFIFFMRKPCIKQKIPRDQICYEINKQIQKYLLIQKNPVTYRFLLKNIQFKALMNANDEYKNLNCVSVKWLWMHRNCVPIFRKISTGVSNLSKKINLFLTTLPPCNLKSKTFRTYVYRNFFALFRPRNTSLNFVAIFSKHPVYLNYVVPREIKENTFFKDYPSIQISILQTK